MATRAIIRFKDEKDEYYVYAGHDGYPTNILPEIESIIQKAHRKRVFAGCGCLVAWFLGETYEESNAMPFYEMTSGFHGDESYRYLVDWDAKEKKWACTFDT